jgi:hypothetical protein
MVLQAIKDRIFDDASNYATWWLAELSHVIWGLRNQVSSAIGFSPFFLVYNSKAILPTDITFGDLRIQFYEEGEAEQTRHVDLDSLEEQRMVAVMRHARHDQQLRRYHDRNVKEASFNVDDLVLRASPRVCQNLLGKSYVLPTSKKLCKVKKEFISNSLA